MLNIALAGLPNAGKSTLFNFLTGSTQRVGNWPGVTVEKRTGIFACGEEKYQVVDLPGLYALTDPCGTEACSLDERVARQYLRSGDMDIVVNVLDALHMERDLYLTVQLLERKQPMVVVLSRMDIAKKAGLLIDAGQLSEILGCPVLVCSSKDDRSVRETFRQKLAAAVLAESLSEKISLCSGAGEVCEDRGMVRAGARYRFIEETVKKCVHKKHRRLAPWLDRIVLNRLLGIPLFLLAMYLMFCFALGVGGAFQDFFDLGSEAIFVNGFSQLLIFLHFPASLVTILANGAGKGIQTTLTFVPVLFAMFLFLSFLEESGYMARAAFLVDRLMSAVGLPGKSLVPVIVGFGCNVPAVMMARTLESERDRILTVMMMPFVPCGARLAIFTVFVATFFPQNGPNVIFCLYLTGIAMAILTGYFLRRTVLSGAPSPLVMELPVWLLPRAKTLMTRAFQRLRGFLVRAGRLIVPVCLLVSALNIIHINGKDSVLSRAGKTVTPVFAPMGIQADNWPAVVGLVTGILAKEVVIGTLNTLYSEEGLQTENMPQNAVLSGLRAAVLSVPLNLRLLPQVFVNPLHSSVQSEGFRQPVHAVMSKRFDSRAGVLSFLLFVLLYFPCVSTLAVMWREVGGRWTLFSVFWSLFVAYVVAVVFWQFATIARHPLESISWILVMAVSVLLALPLATRVAGRVWGDVCRLPVRPDTKAPVCGGGCASCPLTVEKS